MASKSSNLAKVIGLEPKLLRMEYDDDDDDDKKVVCRNKNRIGCSNLDISFAPPCCVLVYAVSLFTSIVCVCDIAQALGPGNQPLLIRNARTPAMLPSTAPSTKAVACALCRCCCHCQCCGQCRGPSTAELANLIGALCEHVQSFNFVRHASETTNLPQHN